MQPLSASGTSVMFKGKTSIPKGCAERRADWPRAGLIGARWAECRVIRGDDPHHFTPDLQRSAWNRWRAAGREEGKHGQRELDGLLQRCSLDATTRVNDAPPSVQLLSFPVGKKDLLVSLVYARQMMFSFWKVVPCFARRPRWHVSSFPAACRGLRRGILFCPPLAWAFFSFSQLTRALALECNAK